jgi:hypothetical protein
MDVRAKGDPFVRRARIPSMAGFNAGTKEKP